MKKEVKYLPHPGYNVLRDVDHGQPVTPVDAFAYALPQGSFKYQFYFVEVIKNRKSEVNTRVVVQIDGTHTLWTTISRYYKCPHTFLHVSVCWY